MSDIIFLTHSTQRNSVVRSQSHVLPISSKTLTDKEAEHDENCVPNANQAENLRKAQSGQMCDKGYAKDKTKKSKKSNRKPTESIQPTGKLYGQFEDELDDSLVTDADSLESLDIFAINLESLSKITSKVHIRVRRGGGKRKITTVEGIDGGVDFEGMLRSLKKKQHCGGSVQIDVSGRLVLQLEGDQSIACRVFLIEREYCSKNQIVIHCFV